MTDPTSLEDTRDIRREIEHTQREMSRTIDEIQLRLSPQYMMQRTKDSIREAGVNTSRNFMDRVRDNPIPSAMVGIGLFLMFRKHENKTFDRMYGYGYEEGGRYDADFAYAGRTRPSSVAEYRDFDYEGGGVRGRVSGAMAEGKSHVDDARERVSGAMSEAKEMTSDAMDAASDGARHMAEMARRNAMRAGVQSRDFFTESPLIGGLAALALGAIVAAVIPETEKENEMLGETRDRLASRAREVAHEQMDRARDVAGAATTAATEAVKKATSTTSSKTDVGQNVGVGSDIKI